MKNIIILTLKSYWLSFVLMALSVGCFVAYQVHGQYVAEDGTLVEAFGFIPLGYLSFLGALGSFIIISIKLWLKSKKRRHQGQ